MKLPVYVVLIISCVSILFCCSFFFDKFFEPDYEVIANKITGKTAEKFKKEKGLYLIGTGGGMMNDIQMMAMSFHYYKEVDFDTARALLVYCVEEYLTAINSSEKIRPYLHNYPFTAKNIEIIIYFYESDGKRLPLGKITIASAMEGCVEYETKNPSGYTLDTLRTETYEESLQILRSRSDSDVK